MNIETQIINSTNLALCSSLLSFNAILVPENPCDIVTVHDDRPAVEFHIKNASPAAIAEFQRRTLTVNVYNYESSRRHLLNLVKTILNK